MNLYNEGVNLEGLLKSDLPIEVKVNVLFDVLKNVLDEGAIRARTVRFKLQKYVNSTDINERIYALNVIASDGNGAKVVPTDETSQEVLEDVIYWISENIAKKYVQNKIESEVEKALVERQDKFMDELKLSIIKNCYSVFKSAHVFTSHHRMFLEIPRGFVGVPISFAYVYFF